MILMALAVFVENIKRPSGTRLCFPAFPGAECAGLLSIVPPGREFNFYSDASHDLLGRA